VTATVDTPSVERNCLRESKLVGPSPVVILPSS
jgi:hypothetical protein